MFKRNKIKLSVLIIAIVVFGVIFSTLASTLFFGIFYKNSMNVCGVTLSHKAKNVLKKYRNLHIF